MAPGGEREHAVSWALEEILLEPLEVGGLLENFIEAKCKSSTRERAAGTEVFEPGPSWRSRCTDEVVEVVRGAWSEEASGRQEAQRVLQLVHRELAPQALHDVATEVEVEFSNLSCIEECFEMKWSQLAEEDQAVEGESHEELKTFCRSRCMEVRV